MADPQVCVESGCKEGTDSVDNRTQEDSRIIDDFININQDTDELKLPDSQTPWCHGGYFNERAEFERLQGKLLHSFVTTGGHYLTIQQLSFSNRDVVLVHQSTNYAVEDDLTELMTERDTSERSPMEPFIDP